MVFEYTSVGIGTRTELEVMPTMRPHFAARMPGRTHWTGMDRRAQRELEGALRRSSASTSSAVAGGGPPAFATRTWIGRPKRRAASVTWAASAGAVGHVEDAHHRAFAVARERGAGALEALGVAPAHGHRGAFGEQRSRAREAEPAARGQHHRRLAPSVRDPSSRTAFRRRRVVC